jgi:ubiquinone/menaquinone biosynthesis C-methylase UbiE
MPEPADREDVQRLLTSQALREPALAAAFDGLAIGRHARVFDVGGGIGSFDSWLVAQRDLEVVGIDLDAELLGLARATLEVPVCAADCDRLPFPDNSFDAAWSIDCVGRPGGDATLAISEIARVTRPGGTVALLGWTDQRVLPGAPMLEAAVNASYSSFAPFLEGLPASLQFERAAASLAAVGLREVSTRVVLRHVAAPLTREVRDALESLITMLWNAPAEPTATWRQLQTLL